MRKNPPRFGMNSGFIWFLQHTAVLYESYHGRRGLSSISCEITGNFGDRENLGGFDLF